MFVYGGTRYFSSKDGETRRSFKKKPERFEGKDFHGEVEDLAAMVEKASKWKLENPRWKLLKKYRFIHLDPFFALFFPFLFIYISAYIGVALCSRITFSHASLVVKTMMATPISLSLSSPLELADWRTLGRARGEAYLSHHQQKERENTHHGNEGGKCDWLSPAVWETQPML